MDIDPPKDTPPTPPMENSQLDGNPISNFITRLRIYFIKRRAISLIRSIDATLDEVDCGVSLLATISPRFNDKIQELDRCMKRLSELDPDCPSDSVWDIYERASL